MRRIRFVLVAGFALVAAACSAEDADVPEKVTRERDAEGVEIVTSSAPAWSEAERWAVLEEPEVEIGVEAGAEEYMLSNIGGAVRLGDGRIVVADGDALVLRTYDSEGRYLSSIGGRGGGPGEFGYLFGLLNCVENELWALVLPRAFSRFDTDGEFIDLLRLTLPEGGSPYAHACNAAGQHLAIGWGMPRTAIGRYRTRTRAMLLSLDGEVLADLGEVFGSERWGNEGGSSPHPYGRQTALALDARRAFIGEGDDFEVREYDLAGGLVKRIRWRGGDLSIDGAEIDRYKNWVIETEQLDPRSRQAQFFMTMEFPATTPAYTTLQIDDSGNLWVRRFARPGLESEDWDVFSPSGVWMGTVAAPIGLTITKIGDEYVLGIFEDEIGTEFVRMYPLVLPGEEEQ